ncbi:hypothetical protein ACFOTA_17840 [Chitinophaga sp. GCM10012297]|uniref:Uncharacterized protein n=1 Tax=Chitinophaga chungangae TaxID=2821488 RepID=A0ABS3YHB8_9BACT|nr:hypothetical protein [Chitinophaga chungangae]MBO9154085.1 hypothetical protein [Chitinophaga chungangae]
MPLSPFAAGLAPPPVPDPSAPPLRSLPLPPPAHRHGLDGTVAGARERGAAVGGQAWQVADKMGQRKDRAPTAHGLRAARAQGAGRGGLEKRCLRVRPLSATGGRPLYRLLDERAEQEKKNVAHCLH